MRNKASHELEARFSIAFVNITDEPEIEVDRFESLLFELLPEYHIDEFSKIATHFWIDEMSDISFESISVQKENIDVQGFGIIPLGLQYRSNSYYKDGLRVDWDLQENGDK